MLKVDLRLLKRVKRLEVDERVPADSPLWEDTGLTFDTADAADGSLRVELVVEESGDDVVADGRLTGSATMSCRRCLEQVKVEIDQPVRFWFRSGITELEAEAEEDNVYSLPPRARELDLSVAVREHVILGTPEYVLCREDCRGLCPHCGTDLNRETCDCTVDPVDDRWSALRRVKLD
jgi:uncharacterized protein